jgi:hypothetical protein
MNVMNTSQEVWRVRRGTTAASNFGFFAAGIPLLTDGAPTNWMQALCLHVFGDVGVSG